MLVEFDKLANKVGSRYATDEELKVFEQFSSSAASRLALYHKMARAETQILAALYAQIATSHPRLFILNQRDVSEQCKREVQYTFRYAVFSLILGEAWLQENLLAWLQTVIRSLKLQPICDVVYRTLEKLLEANLSPAEGQLICPIIRTVRESLTQM